MSEQHVGNIDGIKKYFDRMRKVYITNPVDCIVLQKKKDNKNGIILSDFVEIIVNLIVHIMVFLFSDAFQRQLGSSFQSIYVTNGYIA